jgi:hypothetical protein
MNKIAKLIVFKSIYNEIINLIEYFLKIIDFSEFNLI